MKLFDEVDIPALGAAGPGFANAINELLEKINQRADAVVIPAVVGGVVDNTSMIEDKIGEAIANGNGSVRFADPGPVGVTAIPTIEAAVRMVGAGGRFGTRLVALEDTADPILDFDIPLSVDTIWHLYGPSVERLAIDLSGAPSATGIKVGTNSGWFEGERIVIQGGYRSLDHNGPNAYFNQCKFNDATDCMVYITDGGLEVSFTKMNLARDIPGTTDAYMKVILASGGQKGDLRLTSIQGGSGQGPSGAITNNGIIITAPVLTNLPVVASRVTLDNVIGGGPGLTLTNIESVDWSGGWINTAGAEGGPPVRIYGGGDITFRGVKYRGSFVDQRTYDFTGGSTRGFESTGCYCPTGPVYWLPETDKPTDMYVNDDIPGATDLGQITNDIEGFRLATRRLWGARNFQDRIHMSSVPWVVDPFMDIGTLGDGGVPGRTIISSPDVDGFFSQFIPFRFAVAGTLGRLEVVSRDAGTDTVTIESRRTDGTLEVDDESIVGFIRFDLPH
jgi:hypothetical protein